MAANQQQMKSGLKKLLSVCLAASSAGLYATDTRVVSGIFVFGPESEAFFYCTGEGSYGLFGPDPLMKPLHRLAYELVDRYQQMWVPIYVVVEIEDQGKSEEPYFDGYDSIYWVEHIQVVKDSIPAECYAERELPNRESLKLEN